MNPDADMNKFFGATEEKQNPVQKRPVWVWIICVFYAVSFTWLIFSYVLIFGGLVPLSEDQRLFFTSLTPLDWVMTAMAAVCGVMGTVMLFLLRRAALKFFAAALVLNVAASIMQNVRIWGSASGSPGFAAAATGCLLLLAVTIYVWHLDKKQILR